MTTALPELSVRTRPEGGPVGHAVRQIPPRFLQGRSRIVMLIHGYNVTEPGARATYERFRGRLETGASRPSTVTLCGFLWPGDAHLGPLSFTSYPFEMGDAEASAGVLADFLLSLQGPEGGDMRIDVLAHSLGCRMILETLLALRPQLPQLRLHFAVTMLAAAAVQIDMIEPGHRLQTALSLTRRLIVMYSRADRVLHYAFPLGQTLAREGFFPKALGRFGAPPWVRAENQAFPDDDHGDYWNDPRVRDELLRVTGLGAVPHELRTHRLKGHESPEHRLQGFYAGP